MDCITPGFPVFHHLPELGQTHVHWVDDIIQSSCPLISPSPPAVNLSQHQGLFQWVNSSRQVAKILELQHQSFQWIFGVDFLLDWSIWSPCSPRNSQESSPTLHFKSITVFLCLPLLVIDLGLPGKVITLGEVVLLFGKPLKEPADKGYQLASSPTSGKHVFPCERIGWHTFSLIIVFPFWPTIHFLKYFGRAALTVFKRSLFLE